MNRELELQKKITAHEREEILNIVKTYGKEYNRIIMRRDLEKLLIESKKRLKRSLRRKISKIIGESK